MACVKKLMFLWFQITFVSSAVETATFSRSSFFTTRENKQLKGYVVKRFDSPSLLSCGQQCMRNTWCTSTNYKMPSKKDGKGTCELNKHDIFLINENINLYDQQGVIFSTLLINKGCLISSCLNGGSCFPDNEKQTYSCSCQQPWTGDRCQVKKECPQDWVLHGNSCYHVGTPTLNWNDARTICQNLGGDLAIIRSQDENNFTRDLIRNPQTGQALGVWLGLHRKTDNMFYWIDDTVLAGQYSAWADGEPSSHNSNEEKCVHMYTLTPWKTDKDLREGQWNDLTCNLPGESYKSIRPPAVLCQKKYIRGDHPF